MQLPTDGDVVATTLALYLSIYFSCIFGFAVFAYVMSVAYDYITALNRYNHEKRVTEATFRVLAAAIKVKKDGVQ